MSYKLQPNLLLQQQIKGRYLPSSLNYRGEIALTFSAIDQQSQRPVILKYYQKQELIKLQDLIQRGVMLHAQLRSDHIIPMLDFGVHGQYGGVWCVLSREESPNLTRYVKTKGGLDTYTTCELLISLCESLSPLHHDGKVHGNLKPNNVFVKERPNGTAPQALISDILGAGPCGIHKESTGRVTFNDPSFFTYEQASGKEVNGQTDIAALGLLAYFMLTNSLPFEGRTTDKILAAVIIGSGRTKVKAEDLSGDPRQAEQLARIINECLAKQASSRPKDLDQLMNALLEAKALGTPTTPRESHEVKLGVGFGQSTSAPPIGTQGLGGPSLTPNHSLMNSLGFGQTLGFDAITDQMIQQFTQQPRSTPPPIPSSTPPNSARPTGSHRAIITAPPEGFSPEFLDDSVPGDHSTVLRPPEERTLFSSPSIDISNPDTMVGNLSIADIQELQGLEILSEDSAPPQSVSLAPRAVSQDTILGGVGVSFSQTLMGSQLIEDTKPLLAADLEQLGLSSKSPQTPILVPPSKDALAPSIRPNEDEWGDLSSWDGLGVGSNSAFKGDTDPPTIVERDEPATSVINAHIDHPLEFTDLGEISLDDLGVDALELDALLAEAAIALESEQGTLISPVAPYESDQNEGHKEQYTALISNNDLLISNQGDTERIDVTNILAQLSGTQGSLSDRFEAQNPSGVDLSSIGGETTRSLAGMGQESHVIPELFSSPALHIAPERPTVDTDPEDFELAQDLGDLGLDDFSTMDPKLSGAFPVQQVELRQFEVSGSKQYVQDLKGTPDREPLSHRELDTQLEYQRPEELFPNIPEWQSLIALQSEPIQLSRALLSISLPLSGQLLPFSQFQLEIEGREHEEGFFVKAPRSMTHIPVVFDQSDHEESSSSLYPGLTTAEVNRVDVTLSQNSADKRTHGESKQVFRTIVNFLLLLVALLLTVAGLIIGSGMSMEEAFSLINGSSNFKVERPSIQKQEINFPLKAPTQSTPIAPPLPSISSPKALQDSISPDPKQGIKEEALSPDESSSAPPKSEPQQKTPSKPQAQSKTRRKKNQALKQAKAIKERSAARDPKKNTAKSKSKPKSNSAIKDPFAM